MVLVMVSFKRIGNMELTMHQLPLINMVHIAQEPAQTITIRVSCKLEQKRKKLT